MVENTAAKNQSHQVFDVSIGMQTQSVGSKWLDDDGRPKRTGNEQEKKKFCLIFNQEKFIDVCIDYFCYMFFIIV